MLARHATWAIRQLGAQVSGANCQLANDCQLYAPRWVPLTWVAGFTRTKLHILMYPAVFHILSLRKLHTYRVVELCWFSGIHFASQLMSKRVPLHAALLVVACRLESMVAYVGYQCLSSLSARRAVHPRCHKNRPINHSNNTRSLNQSGSQAVLQQQSSSTLRLQLAL